MAESVAEIVRTGIFSMQVCVPAAWTDDEAKRFADNRNPCGTTNGWFIRKQGSELLAGSDERVACADRTGCVHIMLDA